MSQMNTQDPTDLVDDVETEEEIVNDAAESGESGRLDRLEQNQALLNLLNDPDIAAVIQAKRQGTEVEIKAKTEPETDPLEHLDFGTQMDDDDPAKIMMNDLVGKLGEALNQKLSPLASRLANLEELAKSVTQKDVADKVKAAQERFDDFNQFSQPMLDVMKENPGLNPDELYVVAKHRAGKLALDQPSTETERPSVKPREPMKPRPGADVSTNRRAKFTSALTEALENLKVDL